MRESSHLLCMAHWRHGALTLFNTYILCHCGIKNQSMHILMVRIFELEKTSFLLWVSIFLFGYLRCQICCQTLKHLGFWFYERKRNVFVSSKRFRREPWIVNNTGLSIEGNFGKWKRMANCMRNIPTFESQMQLVSRWRISTENHILSMISCLVPQKTQLSWHLYGEGVQMANFGVLKEKSMDRFGVGNFGDTTWFSKAKDNDPHWQRDSRFPFVVSGLEVWSA